jgi:hypothetical protein
MEIVLMGLEGRVSEEGELKIKKQRLDGEGLRDI